MDVSELNLSQFPSPERISRSTGLDFQNLVRGVVDANKDHSDHPLILMMRKMVIEIDEYEEGIEDWRSDAMQYEEDNEDLNAQLDKLEDQVALLESQVE